MKTILRWFGSAIAILLVLALGIYAGSRITAAYKDAEIYRLEGELAVANGALGSAAAQIEECRQRGERMTAWAGLVSFYGERHQGRPTTSGERFDMEAFTAAHMTLPFGSLVLVLDVRRHTWTLVRINDRGPDPALEREIDLSRAAARQLGMERDGVIPALMITVRDSFADLKETDPANTVEPERETLFAEPEGRPSDQD